MEILIRNQQDKVTVTPEMENLFEKIVIEALSQEDSGLDLEISLLLVDDQTIQELNRSYRGIDQPTDVLSFAINDQVDDAPNFATLEDDNILGDIVISLETAVRQAEEYGHSFERELGFLTVHGVLHLLGYDHCEEEDRELMRQKEESVLGILGLTR